jgi:hypothetical protein
LSFISYSEEALRAEAAAGSLFLHHVRLEGLVLHDPQETLRVAFEVLCARPPNIKAEIDRQLSRLRLYEEPERLNGEHLFALAHLYAIGKAIAIARCVSLGEPVFVKAKALKVLMERDPELAGDIATIVELEPFYSLTRDRLGASPPFTPRNVEHKLVAACEAITRIADG